MQINTINLVGGTKARAKDVNDNINILKSAIYELEENIDTYRQSLEEIRRKPVREMMDIYFSFSSTAPVGAFPLWTGEWISHCDTLYPDFWAELTARVTAGSLKSCTNAAYESDVTTYGQCGCFVIDELNGRVRLPKITRFISSVSALSELATVQNDDLKSHTHQVARAWSDSGFGWPGAGDGPNNANTFSTCATGGTETRPKNVRLALYLQVANNIADISRMNTDMIATQLTDSVAALQAEEIRLEEVLQNYFETGIMPYVSNKENIENKITQITADATHTHYPSAKAVYDYVSVSGSDLSDAVQIVPQTLSDSQKRQARHNIGAGTLNNEASQSTSVTLLGNSYSYQYAVTIGNGASALNNFSVSVGTSSSSSNQGVAVGYMSNASGGSNIQPSVAIGYYCRAINGHSIAIGYSVEVTGAFAIGLIGSAKANNAIQIGEGTNSTANTLNIGLGQSKNYRLLNVDGKIPFERMSVLTGIVSPTTDTAGALGQIYIDKNQSDAYICVGSDTTTSTYMWKKITN